MEHSLFNIKGSMKGGFNNNLITENVETGKKYLIRQPHTENISLLEKIEDEFQRYGNWLDKGNSIRTRSTEEQIACMTKAARNGLRVIDIFCTDDHRIILPFIEDAQTMDEFLPSVSLHDAESIVRNLFLDLHKAHTEHGIVYGDRWSKNILFNPKETQSPIHIDFDLQYEGPNAMDMDFGRMAFYVLHAGGKKVIPALVEALMACGWHDRDFVECIMRGQAEYFKGTSFGSVSDDVDMLFEVLHRTLEKISIDIPEAAQVFLQLNGKQPTHHLRSEIMTLRTMATDILSSHVL